MRNWLQSWITVAAFATSLPAFAHNWFDGVEGYWLLPGVSIGAGPDGESIGIDIGAVYSVGDRPRGDVWPWTFAGGWANLSRAHSGGVVFTRQAFGLQVGSVVPIPTVGAALPLGVELGLVRDDGREVRPLIGIFSSAGYATLYFRQAMGGGSEEPSLHAREIGIMLKAPFSW